MADWIDEQIRRLRGEGMNDFNIALELGVDPKTAYRRRKAMGLPNFMHRKTKGPKRIHQPFKPSICKQHDALIRRLAADGLNNTAIAAACGPGVTKNSVIGWRYRNKI